MFNLGQSELLFLRLIIVLLFGAKKVPELFASLEHEPSLRLSALPKRTTYNTTATG